MWFYVREVIPSAGRQTKTVCCRVLGIKDKDSSRPNFWLDRFEGGISFGLSCFPKAETMTRILALLYGYPRSDRVGFDVLLGEIDERYINEKFFGCVFFPVFV